MTLRLRFWGTRGSVPSPGPHTIRYGGNTPCLEVRTETGGLVILDAGTGIRELGQSLLAETGEGGLIEADVLVTHVHWDHIQGFPFFAPIYGSGNCFTISGPRSPDAGLDRVFRDLMAPAVFPVGFESLSSRIAFCPMGDGERRSGNGYEVQAFAVQHPGGALGYRLSSRSGVGGSFVYISDNELGEHEGYASGGGWTEALTEFVRGASILIHDATYTVDEYERHRGWGHSTFDAAVHLALEAEVDELVLFHHRPERSDDELDRCVAACRALVAAQGGTLRVTAAQEGMSLSV